MNSKSPLESLKPETAVLAKSDDLYGVFSAPALEGIDMLLKGECDIDFLGFYSEVGSYGAQESFGMAADSTPAPCGRERQASEAGFVDAPTMVGGYDVIERASVNHRNLNADVVGRGGATTILQFLVDGDAAFPVEKPREVDVILVHRGSVQKAGELGEHPMPGSERNAEGQSRTKHQRESSEGVRREQVPASKENVCSELGGNVENEVETASSYVGIIPHRVTDSYQRTCNAPVRFVRPGGQGGTADPTWESLDYMGKPWYWDRQCPAGRAYFIRTADTHMVVDPRFLFEWTGPLTYPDQMAFTRLCGVRFFMRTNRRMFEAVIDGCTA